MRPRIQVWQVWPSSSRRSPTASSRVTWSEATRVPSALRSWRSPASCHVPGRSSDGNSRPMISTRTADHCMALRLANGLSTGIRNTMASQGWVD